MTWKRQEGSEPASELKEGETVKNGILTVSQNFLSKIQSGLLTYIVGIQYTDPITNTTLETQSQMSFSLSKQAIEAKYCSITGESVFLYNTNQTLVGSDTITLTANVTNVNISQWQYKKSDGSFVVIPTTNNPTTNGTSIIIKANESALFVNDTAIIKLVTDDPTVYDLHTITKIRDGAAGNSSTDVNKGYQNRGVKYNTGYHDLNASAMPAMIIETLFCDNSHDASLYNALGVNGIAALIADAINGKITGGSAPVISQKPSVSKPSNPTPNQKLVFTYAVKAGGRILPEVQNLNDWAGLGDGTPITDIAIKCNFGTVKYRVHVKGGNWLPYVTGYNWSDHNNGYAGNGRAIDAVEVYYDTPADYAVKYGYQKAQYRISPINSDGYYSWQFDNETGNGQDGYAGCFGVAIDKFQLC